LNDPTPGTPRTRDGKPSLSAKAPRASNGKPDFSGVWRIEPPRPGELERLFGDLSVFVVPGDDVRTFSKYYIHILSDFKQSEEPIRPEAAALTGRHAQRQDHPTSRCLPMGLPGVSLIAYPFKIVQTLATIVMLYEVDGTFRQVHTDGRRLPVDPQPAWLGYSVGKWEGDTLVVNTAGFNDKTWLDAIGHPHSEEMRLQERFRRLDFGHLEVQMTIDDPGTFTKPFTITFTELLIPDTDILEFVCSENEKDRAHMTGQ
jgi:hypothetical protein